MTAEWIGNQLIIHLVNQEPFQNRITYSNQIIRSYTQKLYLSVVSTGCTIVKIQI